MNDSQSTPRKLSSRQKKLSFSQKTRSDNPSSSQPQQYCPVLISHPIKNLGRKYAQENLFKLDQKHHEVVISDEVVRNSKLYKLLRDKIQTREALFSKQCKQLRDTKQKLASDISQINHQNHNRKLNIWQIKNQILELKAMLIDQQQESKRLEMQISCQQDQQPLYSQQDEQSEQQMPNCQEPEHPCLSSDSSGNNEENKQEWLNLESSQLKQEERDIKEMMCYFSQKNGFNPQVQKQESKYLKEFKQEEVE